MRIALLLAVLCPSAFAADLADLAIVGAKIFPAPDAAPLANATILIHDGKIAAVGPNVAVPKGANKLTCADCFVFAGFWNSHVHFTEPKWAAAATESAPVLTRELQEMLTHSGFTTVVDLASDIRSTSALRRRIESREVLGPRIYTAGSGLYPPAGIPYYLRDLPPQIRALLPQPSTAAEAAALVEKNIAAGADVLKLFTGSYVSPSHIKPMPLDVARAAVSVAHAKHELAFAHPSNLEGVRVALESGVDVLAHAPDTVEGIDDGLLTELVSHHMSMIPTLKLFSAEDSILRIRAIVAKFHQLGGSLMFGTDTGFVTDYDLSEEYQQLAVADLSFKDVLAMLTTEPVKRLGLKDEGRIAPGLRADLTVLSADPSSQNLMAFKQVRYTIRAGRVNFDRSQATP
jgi:imidazolonepropionase-like amidohydrolase